MVNNYKGSMESWQQHNIRFYVYAYKFWSSDCLFSFFAETERRISSLGGLISGLGVLKPSLSSSSLPKTAIDYDAREILMILIYMMLDKN